MPRERQKEFKPLSFSTTMRNPSRIAGFLNCLLPYEGQILTNEVIYNVASNLISAKLYHTEYELKVPEYKEIYQSDTVTFSYNQLQDIIQNSPQNHKEAGFEKGWPSRFDTWYKLPMEFGFVFYEMNKPIIISKTGHMLIDAVNETPVNDIKIQKVFLNALMKYQTNNPFRKNANDNVPLLLLLNVIQLLKQDPNENNSGIFRNELSLIICWPNNDANKLYDTIKQLRKDYGFTYGDEIIYEMCLKLLGANENQKNRFKIDQITGEAVDEFIRKMRITGVVSLRGNGRFIDYNTFEIKTIEYVLQNYSEYNKFYNKEKYFDYMGSIDSNILNIQSVVNISEIDALRLKVLKEWATNNSKDYILKELQITYGKNKESKNSVLKLIDKPTRLEFLISIALYQNFNNIVVCPNYHIDDEGIPTFTASGGLADIECFEDESNPLVEVTLMTSKAQSLTEMPAITRHLTEAIRKYPNRVVFSMLVAPLIHSDTEYMAKFSKYQYNVDILTYKIDDFVKEIAKHNKMIEMLNTYYQ